MTPVEQIKSKIRTLGHHKKAVDAGRFFKTGPGQYGEGDVFIGLTVPEQRVVAKKHLDMTVAEVEELLQSPEHEFRLTALLIWDYQYAKSDAETRQAIFQTYLANTRWINNWDLVDSSASQIVGPSLPNGDISLLRKLAKSEFMWERRIAMVATFFFLGEGNPDPTIEIATTLLNDQHDLMHKAVGWALREMGKRCGREQLVKFLATHYRTMPRTALRYAIEHFSAEERQAYLKGTV